MEWKRISRYVIIITSILILVLVPIFAAIGGYDYTSGAGSDHYAFEISSGDFPLSDSWTYGWGGSEISDYTLIDDDDNTFWECVDGGSNYEPIIRFNFTMSDTNVDYIYLMIKAIATYGGGEDADCYVANFNTPGWEKFCDINNGAETQCSINITTNPSYYISPQNQFVAACAGKSMDNAGDLQVDYVNVTYFTTEVSTDTMTVSLNEPADDTDFNLNISNLLINGTCDITDGTIHNISLWDNKTGSFIVNQSNTTVVSDNVKYSFSNNFTTPGVYTWNFECCSVNGVCNSSSSNYTYTILPGVRTFEVTSLNSSPLFVHNGTNFVYGVNITCTGTLDCGRIDVTLDPFIIDMKINGKNFIVYQWEECHNETAYRVIDTPYNFTYPNGTIELRYNKTIIKINLTVCKSIQKYNISYNDETAVFDAREFGGVCSYNEPCMECDTIYDNADGICQSGENCVKFCYENNKFKKYIRLDSRNLINKIFHRIRMELFSK